VVSLHKLPTKPTKLYPVSDTTVTDGPSGPKTKKYIVVKMSWELAKVRLVPCLKTLIEMILSILCIHKNYIQLYTQPTYTEPPDCSTVQN